MGRTNALWVETDLFAISKKASSRICPCAATAGSRWRRVSRNYSTRPPPICGRWRAIPKAISIPAADPAPSSTAFRRAAKGRRSPNSMRSKSMPSPSTARIAFMRHFARRQGLPSLRRRQAGSLLRSEGQVHLGAGLRQPKAICSSRPATRRDPSRHAGRQRLRILQERRDARALDGLGRPRQPDRRHRAGWAGDAEISPAGEGFVLYQMGKREITSWQSRPTDRSTPRAWEPNRASPGAASAAPADRYQRRARSPRPGAHLICPPRHLPP